MTLIAQFLREAEARADQIAIVDKRGRTVTFSELVARSSKLAGAWRNKGVRSGDRVLLAMGIGIDLYVALAAAWRIGAVVVFPEPALGLNGLRHAIRATQPKAFLSSGWYRLLWWVLPDVRGLPQSLTPHDQGHGPGDVEHVDPEHPALISFTSGSTGLPKAIMRSHGFLAAQNACVSELLQPEDKIAVDLVAFPVFVVANLGLGITSVLPNWNVRDQDKADPAALAAHIKRHGVTRALLPPSVCARLCRLDVMPPLKAIFTGGGPVFPDLLRKLMERLPDADIVAVYGSTEAEPIAHLHARDIKEDDWTAMTSGAGLLAGQPIKNVRLVLRDDEIIVTGDHVNKGYLDARDDAANKIQIGNDIWHRTGDAGRLDDQGRLWLLGRYDARVKNLYPFTIEVAARSWSGVTTTALVDVSGRAVLAVEGEARHISVWKKEAAALGDIDVRPVRKIPLDNRHRSKVDYVTLTKQLTGGPKA